MWSYVLRRLLGLVPVLFGITLLVFLFLQLIPGDPAQAILGERGTPEQLEALREKLGLNKPLYVQYLTFVKNILTGDLGTSAVSTIPVAEELKRRWPATFELALAATLVAVVFGIPVGILAAVRKNSLLDTLSMSLSLVGVSMPVFWLGLLLVYFFAVNLHWLPTGGRLSTDLAIDFRPITGFLVLDGMLALKPEVLMDALRHLILPALTLGTIPLAILTRITRSAMLEVLSQDYVRTARAKGLAERQVILKHALKNALLPVVTLVGLQFGTLLGGAILTETIFSWPGIGSYIYEGILNRDYPVVQAGVLVVATVFVLVNLLVDLSYALLDPRIQYR
ncbi:ABC transporter permease [Thermus scotoductus]|uniref:Peptide ABC transporter permease n=2 Tax=Thermus scotoductus TaxID=37636 RepID=A0A430RR62_THESC|nr:ABC transporter permease [Thermus scotoductus]RTG94409.1 peptide ABC transporter permease [Thermus scotoductus]RTG95193.1 peptide ABC transporter permease [Thermus scotoductus]RTH21704.1 peptide ABC transporter permease [Thermus scotoductus]RTH23224.1 peptide ABC transporter permease [Thermus scotoductus]RTH26925.1 peptide ABC transporter permease [Thermus scotoductus]